MYFLSDTVTLIPHAFPFLLTETSHQESVLPVLFHFSDNIDYSFYKIARFVICNYVKEGRSKKTTSFMYTVSGTTFENFKLEVTAGTCRFVHIY